MKKKIACTSIDDYTGLTAPAEHTPAASPPGPRQLRHRHPKAIRASIHPSLLLLSTSAAALPSATAPRPAGWPLAGGQTLGDCGEPTTLQARSVAAAVATMQGFPGGAPDPQQLQATMVAIEQACSLIQVQFRSPRPRRRA